MERQDTQTDELSADVEDGRQRLHAKPDLHPATLREIAALLLIVLLSDLTIYRGEGYTGYAALCAGLPVLLLAGAVRRRTLGALGLVAVLLAGVVCRLVWCGSPGAVVAGSFLVVCFAMALRGLPPWVLHAVVFASRLIAAGHRALSEYWQLLSHWSPKVPRGRLLAVVLPAVTLVVFGLIFALANPDLLATISSELQRLANALQDWLVEFAPGPLEVLFWLGVAWLASGVLRPSLNESADEFVLVEIAEASESADAPLYAAFRNTLVSVIGLFVAYLVFEFQTLWFREFPQGFHYSGYAHEGAAWLTVALALATLLLSAIFRGKILADPRLARLRGLAWLWSTLNLLLAVAVIHRMMIYVDFNGMTRMRTVGFLGISSVVAGFLFVVAKIVRQRSFRWLLRRHLWTVTFAAYLYCVLPVDAWVNRYNVRRILDGDPAPCVQISVHPTSAEGLLQLFPLLECSDPAICDGVSALLAQRFAVGRRRDGEAEHRHWTAFQCADDRLRDRLEEESARWSMEPQAITKRRELLQKFQDYAWQWY